MLYAALLMIASVALTIVGVTALGHGQGEIPALALAIPALWILPQGKTAAWLLLSGLALFGYALPDQPLALSISLFMILPILAVSFSSKSPWQLGAMLIAVVIAMLFGLMALQTESKLSGSVGATCMQLMGVLMIWYAARSWRPVMGNTWWALVLVIPLLMGGMAPAALVALCVTGLIAAMQEMEKHKVGEWIPKMAWVLPAIGFATLVLAPQFEVPSPILVSWLLILGGGLLGEFLLEENEEEEV
ncbi:TPA: hypothetical protein ACX6RU_000266 [Photobacterium damselae]